MVAFALFYMTERPSASIPHAKTLPLCAATLVALPLPLPRGVVCTQNAQRELPPGWHMVGPLVVDRHADFPPQFSPEDAVVKAFLDDAAGMQYCMGFAQCPRPQRGPSGLRPDSSLFAGAQKAWLSLFKGDHR